MLAPLLVLTQIVPRTPPLTKEYFFRGARDPNNYFGSFMGMPMPWQLRAKKLFVTRVFEAVKTAELFKHNTSFFGMTDSDQIMAKMATNFPEFKGQRFAENATVWNCTKLLKPSYPSEYQRAKSFKTTVYYRGKYPSPAYYLWDYPENHPKVTKAWMANELKVGYEWEAEHPEYDKRISPNSNILVRFKKYFPFAKPKIGIVGYSVKSLYDAIK